MSDGDHDGPKQITQLLRCAYCGTTDGPFQRDHVVPRSRGGPDHPHNLVLACGPCNQAKSSRLPSEWKSRVPPQIEVIERAICDRIIVQERGKRGALPNVEVPDIECEICHVPLWPDYANGHLGWYVEKDTNVVIDVLLNCTGECLHNKERLMQELHPGAWLLDLPIRWLFGDRAWLELASLTTGRHTWGKEELKKLIWIMYELNKVKNVRAPGWLGSFDE